MRIAQAFQPKTQLQEEWDTGGGADGPCANGAVRLNRPVGSCEDGDREGDGDVQVVFEAGSGPEFLER
jgi:hypothetical protein